MSAAQIEQKREVIRKHLFLLCPNNSGSTYLSRALATSQNVWSLQREGQHEIGFGGPSTMATPYPLIWGAADKSIELFSNPDNYDWERTKKAWYFHARSTKRDAPIFHTKSPPFLLIPDQLAAHFPRTYFLFMVRNPYAALEGILRRWAKSGMGGRGPKLVVSGARHLVTCLGAQRANIARYRDRGVAFTYEELCKKPDEIAAKISVLVPELGPIDLTQKLAVKGTYDEPLRNMNDEQIARLSPDEINIANSVFCPNAELLSHFDYHIIEP